MATYPGVSNLLQSSLGPGGSFGNTPVANSSAQLRSVTPTTSNPSRSVTGAPTSNPTPTSKGGNTGSGGGGSAPVSSSSPTPQPYYDASTGQTFPSINDFYAAIDNAYQPSYDYLNQAEGAVRSDLPTTLNAAQQNYDVNASQLGNTRTSTVNSLNQNADQAGYQNQSALANTRQLYNELNQGYTQRFGGSSSAGDAAHELANVEQQRQMGQQNRGYQDTIATIHNKLTDVENNYQGGLLQLQQQKQTAVDQANRDFQNKLLTISSNRAELGMDKAQARLGALQDLRNKIFSISQQNTQFEQTLAAQKQAAQLQLQNYAALGYTSGQAALSAVNNYGNQYGRPTSGLQVGQQQGPTTQGLQGAITGNGMRWDPNTMSWVPQ